MRGKVRTVLGDVAVEDLGVTDSHDHLYLSTPALAGEELDDDDAASAVLARFAARGGRTIVQWSPAGTGRRLDRLARVSALSGVRVIAATGRHRQALYARDAPIVGLARMDLARRFVADLDRCGLIKVGTGGEDIDAFEKVSLLAAGDAALVTGAPIAVHLEGGTGARVAVEAIARTGIAAHRVVLGHVGRAPATAAVVEAARTGAWVCLDLPSPLHGTTAAGVIGRVERLVDAGHGAQILLGADTTTRTARDAGRDGAALLDLAVEALGASIAHAVLVDNPARAWARTASIDPA